MIYILKKTGIEGFICNIQITRQVPFFWMLSFSSLFLVAILSGKACTTARISLTARTLRIPGLFRSHKMVSVGPVPFWPTGGELGQQLGHWASCPVRACYDLDSALVCIILSRVVRTEEFFGKTWTLRMAFIWGRSWDLWSPLSIILPRGGLVPLSGN